MDTSKMVAEWLTKARGSHDNEYAASMYVQALKRGFAPDDVMAHRELRDKIKAKPRSSIASATASAASMLKMPIGKRIDPYDSALEAYVAAPNNVEPAVALAKQCMEIKCANAGEFYWIVAVNLDPNNVEYWISLAHAREELKKFGEAITAWERVRKLDEHNGEARQAISNLTAKIHTGSMTTEKPKPVEETETKALVRIVQVLKRDSSSVSDKRVAEGDLERILRDKDQRKFDLIVKDHISPHLQELPQCVQNMQRDRERKELERKITEAKSAGHEDRAAKLQLQLDEMCAEDIEKQHKEAPSIDTALRYAELLMRREKYREAFKVLQSHADHRAVVLKARAMLDLKQPTVAAIILEKIIDSTALDDKIHCEVVRQLVQVYLELQEKEKAVSLLEAGAARNIELLGDLEKLQGV